MLDKTKIRTRNQRTRPKQVPGRGYGRTFDFLAMLVEHPQGVTASTLARRLGIPKSTLSLMLQHFWKRQIVAPVSGTRSLGIGPELIRLAFRIVSNFEIRRVARPHLEWLAAETREDVYLGVRNGLEAIYIDRVDGLESVRLNVELGAPRPLHSTALGKLILALSPPALLDAVVRTKGLTRITPNTLTDRSRLERELAQIRKRGFATSDGENIEGIYAIAAPIIGPDQTVAGVCLSTPRSRGLQNRARSIPKILEAADRINRIVASHGVEAARTGLENDPGGPAGAKPPHPGGRGLGGAGDG